MMALMEKYNIPKEVVQAKLMQIQEQAKMPTTRTVEHRKLDENVNSPPGVARTLTLQTTSLKDEDFERETTPNGDHHMLPLSSWNKAQLVAELRKVKVLETAPSDILKSKKKAQFIYSLSEAIQEGLPILVKEDGFMKAKLA